MIGIVVAAHGKLAEQLVETARLVVPAADLVRWVGIEKLDDSASYEGRLKQAIKDVDLGGGVLMLTDMFGGSPSNIGLSLHHPGTVEVLTGANLPMVIRAMQLSVRGADLTSAARDVKDYGRRAITIASEVLSGEGATDKQGGA